MERLPHGCRRLAVRLNSGVDPVVLWQVLTDYEGLSRFIPNLVESRVLQRQGRVITLDQVGSQQLLGLRFTARVRLELTEDPELGQLSFRMVQGDFRRFEGLWEVRPLERGSSLLYALTVQGCVGMPIHLIEQRLRHDLSTNLRAVQQEAEGRGTGLPA
jgi:ribosome-associated toxin RatA of RatAB toxin-antitoxin module